MDVILILLLGVLCVPASHGASRKVCYAHYDISAKYQLRHDKAFYPTNEINLILKQHPEMKSMFKEDDLPLDRPPSHYSPAPQPMCPYKRFTLYSFFYAGKDCYVIYPDVQKIMFVQCGNDNNRDCQQCSTGGSGWGYGNQKGVSKCEEDYDYRYVWAYCSYRPTPPRKTAPRRVYDVPRKTLVQKLPKIVISPRPRPPPIYYDSPTITPKRVLPEYRPAPKPEIILTPRQTDPLVQKLPGIIPGLRPAPRFYYDTPREASVNPLPTLSLTPKVAPEYKPAPIKEVLSASPVYVEYPANTGWGSAAEVRQPKKVVTPMGSPYRDPWNTMYRTHVLEHRWKRSAHTTHPQGKIERMKLFLPHHCGCKRFTC